MRSWKSPLGYHRAQSYAYLLPDCINNMAEYTKHSSTRLFAGDTIIYLTLIAEMTEKTPRRPSSFGKVRGCLADGVACWQVLCHQNNQEVDSHRYPHTHHGQILSEETSTKYLNGYNSTQHDMEPHIEGTAAKGNKKLGFKHVYSSILIWNIRV